MKKRIIGLAIVISTMSAMLPAHAQEATTNGNFDLVFEGEADASDLDVRIVASNGVEVNSENLTFSYANPSILFTTILVDVNAAGSNIRFEDFSRWINFPALAASGGGLRAITVYVSPTTQLDTSDAGIEKFMAEGSGIGSFSDAEMFGFFQKAYLLTQARSEPLFKDTDGIRRIDIVPAYYLVMTSRELATEHGVLPTPLAKRAQDWLTALLAKDGRHSYFDTRLVSEEAALSLVRSMDGLAFEARMIRNAMSVVTNPRKTHPSIACGYYEWLVSYFDSLSDTQYKAFTMNGKIEVDVAMAHAACVNAEVDRAKVGGTDVYGELRAAIQRLVRLLDVAATSGPRSERAQVISHICTLTNTLPIEQRNSVALGFKCRN